LANCPPLDLNQQPPHQFYGVSLFEDDPRYHPYMYRSYRAMQALCDLRNYKYITQVNRQAVENFFHSLFVNLHRPDVLCNFNHVAKVVEYFLKKDPEVCINYIIHYNLPFRFLQFAEFQYVQHFILTLFNCSETPNDIGEEEFKKMIKYAEATNFFQDWANGILLGQRGIPSNKIDVIYKPSGVENLIQLHPDAEIESSRDDKSPTHQSEQINYLVEEAGGFRSDIDLIQNVVRNKKKVDSKLLINKSQPSPNKSPQSKRVYPSLVEKRKKMEEEEEAKLQTLEAAYNNSGGQGSKNFLLGSQQSVKGSSSQVLDKLPSQKYENLSIKIPQTHQTKTQATKTDSSDKFIERLSTPPDQNRKTTTQNAANLRTPGQQIPLKTEFASRKISTATEGTRKPNTASNTASNFHSNLPSNRDAPTKPEFYATTDSKFKRRDDTDNKNELRKSSQDLALNSKVTKRTILNELDPEPLGEKELQNFNNLYIVSTKNMVETEIEKEAKKPEYSVSNIRANDSYSLALCELLDVLLKKTFMNSENPKISKLIGLPDVNFAPLWAAIFADGEGQVFTRLLKVKFSFF